jgi:hypothetical protein
VALIFDLVRVFAIKRLSHRFIIWRRLLDFVCVKVPAATVTLSLPTTLV